MWESFGPTHHDRLRALARTGFEVDAIELSSVSALYKWERDQGADYRVHTLDDRPGGAPGPRLFWRLLRCCLRSPARDVFFCHYPRASVFLAAVALRLLGRRVFTMIDSKFDDYPRSLWREVGKSLLLAPYTGALVASRRTSDYLAFLGMRRKPIELGYDTIDVARLRAAIGDSQSDEAFATRPFLVVARLIPKKNIGSVLQAFAAYRSRFPDRRELHIIGYGPLRDELERKAAALGIWDAVRFLGMQKSEEVAEAMGRSLALILASTEEQFGLVINEALAVGLPVIISQNAGAVDVLLENLGNGIVIDPYDLESIVLAMAHLGRDEITWQRMRTRAQDTATRGDAARFTEAVQRLLARVRK